MNSITASDSSNGFYLISGKKYTKTQIKESTRKMAGVRWKQKIIKTNEDHSKTMNIIGT